MRYILPAFLVMVGICSGTAFAEEITGTIGLGGQYLNVRGDMAKFNEYGDIDSGVTGLLNLDVNLKNYYLSLDGKNIGWDYNKAAGLDNQSYSLKGGMYEQFKYSLFYDETPHNITFDAKSAFSGIGSNKLTGNIDPGAALPLNNFDYRTKRTTYGGSFEGSFNTPFFFSANVDRSEIKGILPTGTLNTLSGGGIELPLPVNYSTDNLYLETGYRTRNVIFKIDGTLSQFENHNGSWLSYEDPASVGPTNTNYTLPPDNTYYKIGGSLMVRLPLNSSFVARGSYAKLENNQNLIETGQSFKGDVNNTSISAALASNPVTPLNLRLFYNFFERDNSSTSLANYGGSPTTRYDYIKQSTGIDIGYRLPVKTRADAGYEYQSVIRTREDGTETRDHTVYVQLKNSFLDWMSGKVRYEHLIRNSDTAPPASIADPNDRFFIDNFRRFDVADKTQDKVKVGIDFQPLNNLDLGVEYNFKHNSYDNPLRDTLFNDIDHTPLGNSLLGVQSDTRHELYVDANYAVSIVKLNCYFDLELVERKMNAHDTLDVNPTPFNWSSKREDTSYTYGFKADVDIIKNVLTAQAGWRYEKAYGSNDFTIPATAVLTVPVQNIGALDNFVRQTLTAKFGYHVTKQILVDFGYTYERLKYDDDAWIGYQTADPALILTGAYANPNYEAHLGFLNLTYKF